MAVRVVEAEPSSVVSPSAAAKPTGSSTQRQRQSSLRPSASSIWLKGRSAVWLRRAASPSARHAQRTCKTPFATALPCIRFSSRTSAVPVMSRMAAGGFGKVSAPSMVTSFSRVAARRTPASVTVFCSMPPSLRAVMTSVDSWAWTLTTSP